MPNLNKPGDNAKNNSLYHLFPCFHLLNNSKPEVNRFVLFFRALAWILNGNDP